MAQTWLKAPSLRQPLDTGIVVCQRVSRPALNITLDTVSDLIVLIASYVAVAAHMNSYAFIFEYISF